MKPNIDIIKNFSALQQQCAELGRSNVSLAQENVRLLKDMILHKRALEAAMGQPLIYEN